MKMPILKSLGLAFLMAIWVADKAFAAEVRPTLLKAKQEADAKGYTLITNHDEVVAKAKTERKVRVLASMSPANIKAATAAFTKKYPFIDVHVQESTGAAAIQRLLLDIKGGGAREWDVIHVAADFYSEYTPYLWKGDLLGMAENAVLHIPPPMIDPKYRNVVALFTFFQVTSYNPKLVPPHLVPKTWEDLLRPEWKGRKFAADIRRSIVGMVPGWGLEKTLDFARKIAAQQPIWGVGPTKTLMAMIAGEVPMMMGPNFATVKRAQSKDRTGALQYVILEPVPVRFGEEQAILATAQHPHTALLWLEWMASPEAQKIADEHEPFASSVYVRGSAVEQELRGKKLSVVGWESQQHMEQWQAKVVEAYGFPKAEAGR